MKIAVFGATGYIGRSLIAAGIVWGMPLVPFSRDRSRAQSVFSKYGISEYGSLESYDTLINRQYDVIINASGVGSPSAIKEGKDDVFRATESMDTLLFEYLALYPKTRVYNISTGAVFGLTSGEPITEESRAQYDPEHLTNGDRYALAKLVSEAKHRAHTEYAITDLRVFAFVSRFLNTEESFFISQVAACLLKDGVFTTGPEDMMRDYVSGEELLDVVLFLQGTAPENGAHNVESVAPISKFDLLKSLTERSGLCFEVGTDTRMQSPTGQKNAYYSSTHTLQKLGYTPKANAHQIIERELTAFLTLQESV